MALTSKSLNAFVWIVASVFLFCLAYRLYDAPTKERAPLPEAAPATSVQVVSCPLPAYSASPRDWPYLRFMEMAAGSWVPEDIDGFSVDISKKRRGALWSFTASRPEDGGTRLISCSISPELKDGGFHGSCNDSDFYVRLRMNQDKKLHIECSEFEGTFIRKATQ